MLLLRPTSEPVLFPSGYGFRRPSAAELRDRNSLLDLCAIWEAPRRHGARRYLIGVDVADGMGGDLSAIQVIRAQTLDEPAEQVAEYASNQIAPAALAYVIQAIGQYYTDADHVEAKVAVEQTHHGLSTIDTLHLHLGYQHFYRWEYFDAADPSRRYANSIGWYTTPRTRPILIDKLRSGLTTLDPVTGLPDLITHSPLLHDQLQDFQTSGQLWEAAAAAGAYDDCVMALAIAYVVMLRSQAGEMEPLEERRRRKSEQLAHLAQVAERDQTGAPDWRNTPATAEEMRQWTGSDEEPEDLDSQLYDPRVHDDSAW